MDLACYLHDSVRTPGQLLSGLITLRSSAAVAYLRNQAREERERTHIEHSDVYVEDDISDEDDDDSDNIHISPTTTPRTSPPQQGRPPIPPIRVSTSNAPIPHFILDVDEVKMSIVGKCILDRSRITPPSYITDTSQHPSFTLMDTGNIVLDTTLQKKTNTREASNGVMMYEFSALLPMDLPPSFRGSAIKFVYLVIVEIYRGTTKLGDIKLPFRVRVSPYAHHPLTTPHAQHMILSHSILTSSLLHRSRSSGKGWRGSENKGNVGTFLPSGPTSPTESTSTSITTSQQSSRDHASSPIPHESHHYTLTEEDLTPVMFNISKTLADDSAAHVVRLTLSKRVYRPGDTVRGLMEFGMAQVACHRVVITLETEEQVQKAYLPKGSRNTSSHRKVYWSYHQYIYHAHSTHFMFSIPIDVVANFSTEMISVSWHLAFKFITGTRAITSTSTSISTSSSLAGPDAEPLGWTLPLQVIPHHNPAAVRQPMSKMTHLV